MAKSVKTSTTPFQLPEDVYAAIGEVAVAWAGIEVMIGSGLAAMLKADPGNFIAITSNMNLSPQIDSAMTLCHLALPAAKRLALLKVLDRTRTMNAERNRIVHGRWMQTKKAHIVVRITARAAGDPSERTELMTAKSIRNFAKQVRELGEDLAGAYVDAGLLVLDDLLRGDGAVDIAM